MREGPLSALDLSGYKRSKPLRCWTVDLSHKEIGVSICNPGSDPLGAALLDTDSLVVTLYARDVEGNGQSLVAGYIGAATG